MELHEYYAKRILKKTGLPVLKGEVVYTPEEAHDIAQKMGGDSFWIKPQIMGKNFDIYQDESLKNDYFAQSPQEVEQKSDKIFGTSFTKESPDYSSVIQRLYIEQASEAPALFSFVIRMDFERLGVTLSVKNNKGDIFSHPLDNFILSKKLKKEVLENLNTHSPILKKQAWQIIEKSFTLFKKYQMMAIEIDPIVHQGNHLVIINARLIFDPDSLFRFPELIQCREIKLGHEREATAKKNNFRYTHMQGNIACLVNGIGLGWATIDTLQTHQEEVACLLDLGTNPTIKSVSTAMRLALAEPNVDAIFVNIFGGLTSCKIIAKGLLEAATEIPMGIPVIVRLVGFESEEAKKILKTSVIPFVLTSKISQSIQALKQSLKENI